MKKPTSVFAGGHVYFFRSLWPFTSGHGSPPAWMSHDDGGGRDGGESASISKLRGNPPRCQILFLPPQHHRAENGSVLTPAGFTRLAALAAILLTAASVSIACAAVQSSSAPQATPKSKPAPPPAARIDINHASMEELLKVPGMTSTWAARIVRFRPYRTKADLLEHGVLPGDVYDRIKDSIIAHRNEQ
jgi:DNA uptake protein ComE-like DNA-binding protein